ncbi:MAG: hypothetical protein HOO06_12990 [Bdellovibrionaceae bacterium]|nr:hypothetical protein [Pseudobdellovibrionaceae bacterium]
MHSSFWIKFFLVTLFTISANPGKIEFVFQDINLTKQFTCTTADDPSSVDPLSDQKFDVLATDNNIEKPTITQYSYIDEGVTHNPTVYCTLDKKQLTYSCSQDEYRHFVINLKVQWHPQGANANKQVHFTGNWLRGKLYLKPQRIFCHQNIQL